MCVRINASIYAISGYERGHQRPPLTVYTFQPPNPNDPANNQESPSTPVVTPVQIIEQHHQPSSGGTIQIRQSLFNIILELFIRNSIHLILISPFPH